MSEGGAKKPASTTTIQDQPAPARSGRTGKSAGPAETNSARRADVPTEEPNSSRSEIGAPAWGSGTTGSYAVYRDTMTGFTPGPSNRVASGVAGPSWTDTLAPADTDLHYLVRAENDETCGGGPANGGVTDANLVFVMARNDTSQAAPGDVGDTLFVDEVNGAHARLTWSAATGAAGYRVYRAASPDLTFDLHASDSVTLYDDPDVLVDGQDWYYLVVAEDACGNEGP